VKFKTQNDVQMFLVEVGRIDLVAKATVEYKPDLSILDQYIKKRKPLIGKLKDFRKSQDSKDSWRRNRYKHMKGIKKFHTSTAGKKFHRSLGRFLATRDFKSGEYKREASEVMVIQDVCEVLKALSSLKTHALIEFDYYHQLEDEIDLCVFIEELLPSVSRIESALVRSDGVITADDLEFLTRLCDFDSMVLELASNNKVSEQEIRAAFEQALGSLNEETHDNVYLTSLNTVKGRLCS
jgi:hypothetical protein